jgi:hypothetical protein
VWRKRSSRVFCLVAIIGPFILTRYCWRIH